MKVEHFEKLVEAAGMNIFSKDAPQLLVSLHVPTMEDQALAHAFERRQRSLITLSFS